MFTCVRIFYHQLANEKKVNYPWNNNHCYSHSTIAFMDHQVTNLFLFIWLVKFFLIIFLSQIKSNVCEIISYIIKQVFTLVLIITKTVSMFAHIYSAILCSASFLSVSIDIKLKETFLRMSFSFCKTFFVFQSIFRIDFIIQLVKFCFKICKPNNW